MSRYSPPISHRVTRRPGKALRPLALATAGRASALAPRLHLSCARGALLAQAGSCPGADWSSGGIRWAQTRASNSPFTPVAACASASAPARVQSKDEPLAERASKTGWAKGAEVPWPHQPSRWPHLSLTRGRVAGPVPAMLRQLSSVVRRSRSQLAVGGQVAAAPLAVRSFSKGAPRLTSRGRCSTLQACCCQDTVAGCLFWCPETSRRLTGRAGLVLSLCSGGQPEVRQEPRGARRGTQPHTCRAPD